MRVKAKTKENRLSVRVTFSRKEEINRAEMSYFASQHFRHFLYPVQEKKRVVEYSGSNGVPLMDYLDQPISQYDFFSLIEQIADVTRVLKRHQFSPGRVLWNLEHIYINELTRDIQLIYLPIEQDENDTQILVFFVRIMNALRLSPGQDTSFLKKFYRFLQTQHTYQPEEIEHYIEKIDRSIVEMIKRRSEEPSVQQTLYQHVLQKERNQIGFPRLMVI